MRPARSTGRRRGRQSREGRSMAKSKETKSGDGRMEMVEQGDIYFVYRPKVQEAPAEDEEAKPAEGIEDVERFYMVLKPDGGEHYRMVIIGRKRMPEVERHERNWGCVERTEERRVGKGRDR